VYPFRDSGGWCNVSIEWVIHVLGAAVINRLHVIIDIVLADVLHYQGRT
jgi:hypothetical protein